jgi:hypothetical protein
MEDLIVETTLPAYAQITFETAAEHAWLRLRSTTAAISCGNRSANSIPSFFETLQLLIK